MPSIRSLISAGDAARCAHDDLPIARIGLVQPHGVLMVVDRERRTVEHVSANVHDMLGVTPDSVLGRSPTTVFADPRSSAAMVDIVNPDRIYFDNPYRLTQNGQEFEAVCHINHGKLFIEIEPYVDADRDYAGLVGDATMKISQEQTIQGLYNSAVDLLQSVTGYSRVMLYRFWTKGHGQVVAEKLSPAESRSFDGLYFPASDIPEEARQVLLTGKTRYTPSVTRPGSTMLTRNGGGAISESGDTIDMTHAWLRGVHACHNGYMTAIETRGSMVFPIIVDGVLWGLFVCHNAEEKYINYDSRVVVEQMAMMFMSKLIELEPSAHRISDRRATARRMLDELSIGRSIIGALGGAGASRHSRLHARTVAMIARQLGCLTPVAADVDTGSAAESGAPSAFENDLLSLVDADGAAVVRGNTVFRFGQAPDEITVRGIAGLIATRMATPDGAGCGFYATNDVGDLAQVGDETRAHAAGVLAVAPNGAGSDLILWFRKEQRIDATWAGRPPEAEELNTPAMLRPRSSAGRVQKVLAGVARPWTETEGRVAAEFADEVAHGWQSAGAAAEGAVAARAAYGYGEGDRDGASTATSAA